MKNLILLILTFISIVTTSFGQVKLTNRILVDPTISDSNDYSKKFKFNLSNFTPGSTRIYTFPDSNITLVGESSIQSLTNKTFNADSNTISNINNNSIKSGAGIDATKIADGSVTNTEFQYLNGVTSNIVGVSDTQTFTNKTFTDATTYFQDNLDNTKKVQFQLSEISSATTRALTIPDANTTIVGTDVTQTLTNKTINSSNNSISLNAVDITDFNSAANTLIAIQKGAANGIATLDSGGKIPASQLSLSSVAYQGTWNSTTNIPTLSDGVGSQGNYYVISVAGTTSLDGITDWQTGDWAIFNGTVWEKADHTDQVTSVAGKQGAVTLQLEDIADLSSTDDLPEGSNLYYSDARVNANTNVAANTTHTSLTNNPHSVTKVQIGLSNVENLKVNLSATTSPTIIDDTTLGYSVGSRWIDNTNNKEYVCVDATTAAAIWNETTSAEQVSAGTGLSKTGNTIDAVGSTTIIANTNNLEVNSSNTNNEILLSAGSVGIAATYGALPLNNSNSVSGVLSIANGGTNSSSFSSGSRIIATNSGNTALESTSLDPSNLLTTSGVQTLTNKTFTDNTTIIQDNIDNTKKIQFELSGITGGVTRILTIPHNSVTIVGANSVQTLTNKTLITPVIATISNTGTLTLPTSTTTLVGRETVDTFINKTISSANNTIDISASDITSGTFANARIAQSNVTQHEASINHDNLTGLSANEHIDHSVVSVNAGVGLNGGGTIAASRTIELDVNGLTADAAPDVSADYVLTYDASAATHKKVLVNDLSSTPIYGSNFYQQASDTESQTTATTLQTKTTLTTGSLPAGTYRLGYSFEVSNAANAVLTEVEVMLDGVVVTLTTCEADNDYKLFGGFVYQSLSGVVTATIKHRVQTTGTAKLRRARLELWRVN